MFNVTLLDQAHVIFDGVAKSVILPGDEGEFEVLDFHKPVVSSLKRGEIIIDNMGFPVARGIMRFYKDTMTVLVEL